MWLKSASRIFYIVNLALGVVLATALLAIVCRHRVSSVSVDFGWHYLLVDYFSTAWAPFSEFEKIHGAMSGYPPATHIFAAYISKLFLLGPFGITVSAIFFCCIVYCLLFEGARTNDEARSTLIFISLLVALIPMRLKYLAFGSEVAGNFFLPQIAGEAVTLAILMIFADRHRSGYEILFLPFLIFLLGWVYPLAQLQVLAGMGSLWLYSSLKKTDGRPYIDSKAVISALIFIGLGSAAIRFHPSYAFMRRVADNEGSGSFNSFPLWLVALMAAVLVIVSALILRRKASGVTVMAHPRFLASVGLGAAGAFFPQYLALLLFGYGSEYGAKKHLFSITTALVVSVIILIADRVSARKRLKVPATIAIPICVFLASGLALLPSTKSADIFLSYQKQARDAAAANPNLYGKTIARFSDLMPSQNFTISLVDLRVADALAVKHAFSGEPSMAPIQFDLVGQGGQSQICPIGSAECQKK